jgi:hypothetical protein
MKIKWLKTAFPVAASAGLILLVLHLQRPAPPEVPEPVIDGNPLSYYTLQLRHAQVRPEVMDKLIQHRTQFMPLLIEQMGANESGIRRLVRRSVAQLPPGLRNTIELEQQPDVLRAGASWGLLHLLRGYDNFSRRATQEELEILVPALRNALKDQSIFVRLNAAGCLSVLDRDSPQTKELVTLALHDKHRGVRYNAVYALWNLFLDEKKVVSFLDGILKPAEKATHDEATKNLKEIVSRVLGTYDDPNDFE